MSTFFLSRQACRRRLMQIGVGLLLNAMAGLAAGGEQGAAAQPGEAAPSQTAGAPAAPALAPVHAPGMPVAPLAPPAQAAPAGPAPAAQLSPAASAASTASANAAATGALAKQPDAASGADDAAATERRVKAAFLYKFLGYTEFPSAAFGDRASPVVVGVAGSDDMLAELLRSVAGRTLHGRPITVKAVREGDNPGPLHLLFVAGSDGARVLRILRASPRAMLAVTECEGGLQYGSVINFRMVDEHVRFDVSLDAAEKNNVRLSSRLLNVANHVQKGTI